MPERRRFDLLIPGDWTTPTGGYHYDRRMTQALESAGWTVDVHRLDADWPRPDARAQARAAARVSGLADGSCVVADGLAYGVLDELVAAHAERLQWVALVHHPLHLESGLAPAWRAELLARETRALQCARRVIVTSPRTAQDVAAMGVAAQRITVVEPGTDPWPGVRRPADTPAPGGVRLLCVATATPRKGHALLLQALAGLQALPWQLHCVGSLTRSPDTTRDLLAQSQALGLLAGPAPRVVWHGELDAAALHAQYAQADLLVLPSLHEGYGMVVAEALAAGLPVLCTDAGALAQTLPPGAGQQVPAGDVPALQAALQRLIGSTELREQLAAGARAAGAQLPGWPRQAHQPHQSEPRPPAGFSADWLQQREPFDAQARQSAAAGLGLPARLQAWRAAADGPLRVIDLACGTGANLRWLAPRLGGEQQWLVTDHDTALLHRWPACLAAAGGAAAAPLGDRAQPLSARLRFAGPGFAADVLRQRVDLAQQLERLPWQAAQLVTASALLDLVSLAWMQRLVVAAAAARAAVLMALSVDGRHRWTPVDRDDDAVGTLFAAHQQRDKGFAGPALGATAGPVLMQALRGAGYRVFIARSDWRLEGRRSPADLALERALIDGMAAAACEQQPGARAQVRAWQQRRQALSGRSRLQVGHVDVLALPPP